MSGASHRVKTPDVEALNVLGADGWEAFAAVPAAFDGYAYATTEGIHVLLRRSVCGDPTDVDLVHRLAESRDLLLP